MVYYEVSGKGNRIAPKTQSGNIFLPQPFNHYPAWGADACVHLNLEKHREKYAPRVAQMLDGLVSPDELAAAVNGKAKN